MTQDIRWKQRFANYQKAFSQLTEFMEKDKLNKFEVQGLIQCFEYTFELGWKTLKDFLEQEGYEVKSPRSAIQIAFQSQWVEDGHTWIDMLDKRNLMAHTYNEEFAERSEQLIREKYYDVLQELVIKLGDQSNTHD